MGEQQPRSDVSGIIDALERGDELPEGQLVRLLLSPACPARVVELLCQMPWARESRRIPALMVRHPSCPRFFALGALGRLGWHDLLLTARDPRADPAVRRQAERRLADRVRDLSLGERTALARRATRGLIGALLSDPSPACIQALITNPQFRESDAVRLVRSNRHTQCLATLLRHQRWGRSREVILAAVACRTVPLGVALGLAASLGNHDLKGLVASPEVAEPVRAAAIDLVHRRGSR